LACVGAASLAVANCSQQNMSSSYDAKYGVHASRRVVRDGEPVPKGGGRELVGRPYVIAGRTYVPHENPSYAREGLASWYGLNFHGRLTANGEIFDRDAVAAAHTTMPLPSYARVTNLENGRSIIVRVNDRGPYHGNRIIDVSQRTAEALDFRRKGTAHVRVEYVRRASPTGSDDRILLSSLRTDGRPATLSGLSSTLVAQSDPQPDAPRQALAVRSYEPTPAYASSGAASESYASQRVAAVPLPPERPFDLGTVPNAATPIPLAGMATAARPASRPVVAGLSYAAFEPAAAGLRDGGSFQPLATKDVTRLNLRR
jgi:rare lipoprotein A